MYPVLVRRGTEKYALATGEAAAYRLGILHELYGPGTRRVLLEAGLREERVPALGFDPPECHRRGALLPAHRQRERLRHEIPVGSLVDARLALDPAAVRLLDVLAGRSEDVEDQPSAGEDVEARRRLRAEKRVPVREDVDEGEEPDPRRRGRGEGEQAPRSELGENVPSPPRPSPSDRTRPIPRSRRFPEVPTASGSRRGLRQSRRRTAPACSDDRTAPCSWGENSS